MAWIYLLIAAVFEVAWTFSLKFMDIKKLRAIRLGTFTHRETWLTLAPFGGYILCGLVNVIFFSMAMKEIPASTCLAIWMGMSLVGIKLMDTFYFKEPYDIYQVLFMALILIGIVGLKRTPA